MLVVWLRFGRPWLKEAESIEVRSISPTSVLRSNGLQFQNVCASRDLGSGETRCRYEAMDVGFRLCSAREDSGNARRYAAAIS